ncbi:YfcC family protein [Romboutsia sp.]|uniref:YfcC family protein n=1 Tax=Romboutsia sp. TaxID=1965302 RepID=UPI003F38B72C
MIKSIKMPHTYILLTSIAIFAAILTYIVPAGSYERKIDSETNREYVLADSFQNVEQTPVTPFGVVQSIPKGMNQGSQIIFFILLIGGAFGIIQKTGAINAGIGKIVSKIQGREKLVIPVLVLVFSFAGAVIGCAEELMPFYPIIISLCLALGFDTITGTAIVLIGAGAGFAGAFLNPFTIGVAQGIAGLPLFSGLAYRVFCYVILVSVTILYIYRYAKKIQQNPELSATYEEDKVKRKKTDMQQVEEFTKKHKWVLIVFALGIVSLSYGVMKLGFYITELAAIFLIIGVIGGLIGGLKLNEIADEFVNGAKDMVLGAMMVGFATAIMVILTEGNIIDTIIHSMSAMITNLPPALSGVGMFIVQSLTNLFIPSGSGQAAVSMPIMAPIADLAGISRQTAVLAYQFGDGFSNVISPTSGYFMASIAIAGVKWDKWAKWMLPLFLIWMLLGCILITISVYINYGPF